MFAELRIHRQFTLIKYDMEKLLGLEDGSFVRPSRVIAVVVSQPSTKDATWDVIIEYGSSQQETIIIETKDEDTARRLAKSTARRVNTALV